MKLRDLPLSVAQEFGNDKVSFTDFVQPLKNLLVGCQFIDKTGKETHAASSVTGIYFDEPLSGPFYDYSLIGFGMSDQRHGLLHPEKALIAFGKIYSTDKGCISSQVFFVKTAIRPLEKYMIKNNVKWIYYRGCRGPIEFNSLTDYIAYIKKTIKWCKGNNDYY